MSVVKASVANMPRSIPFTVRLEPYLVESICQLARIIKTKGMAQVDVNGLLFGKIEDGLRIVEALKTFKDAGPKSDLARRERLEKSYDAALAEAAKDRELSALELIGWFSFRNGSGLLTSDVVFHNQKFKNPEDLALVVWAEADTQITAELYSKSQDSALSSEDYRWSSVRLSTEIRRMSEPIELAMRMKISEDSYLRTYETAQNDSKLDELRKKAENIKDRLVALFPKKTGTARDVPARAGSIFAGFAQAALKATETGGAYQRAERLRAVPKASAAAATAFATVGTVPGFVETHEPSLLDSEPHYGLTFEPAPRSARTAQAEVSGLPMVIRTPARSSSFPWHWMVAVFVLCCATVFAFLALGGLQGENGRLGQIVRLIFPGSDLNLRVKTEDDRLRLSWNQRNPAVASANDGTLQIFDGQQHREIHLDGRQIADGSVLYKPTTSDVTFRLEVHGEQSSSMGSVRVLDGPIGAQPAGLDVTNMNTPPPSSAIVPSQPIAAMTTPAGTPPPLVIYRKGPDGKMTVPVPVPGTVLVTAAPTAAAAKAQSNSARGPEPASLTPIPPTEVSAAARAPGEAPSETNGPSQNPAGSASTQSPEGQSAALAANAQRTVSQKPEIPQQASGGSLQQPQETGSTINPWDSNLEGANSKSLATSSAQPSSLGFVPPRPLLQVMPNTRSIPAGALGSTTRVEVEVRINQLGHVTYAHLLNHRGKVKGTLASAAITAAKQWTFEPATLHGQRVESYHTIVYEFRPESQ